MLAQPARRRMVMARFRKVAMTRGRWRCGPGLLLRHVRGQLNKVADGRVNR